MSAAGRAGFRLLRLEAAPGWAAGGRAGGHAERAACWALAEVLVPAADSPIFAGHFPGQPVLPGIAHLALVQEVLDELGTPGGAGSGDPGGGIVEVQGLRLRRAIGPGDRLALHVEASGGDDAGGCSFRFELRRLARLVAARPAAAAGAIAAENASAAGELGSHGTVRIVPPGHRPHPATAETILPPAPPAVGAASGFPAVADLLPHAPPALLLASVLEAGDDGVACAGLIAASHPLGATGEVPGFMAIELAAQAAAAHETLLRRQQQATRASPRIGYLVGVREARLPPTLPTSRILRITAIRSASAAALSTYEMEIVDEAGSGRRLATGIFSTYLSDA